MKFSSAILIISFIAETQASKNHQGLPSVSIPSISFGDHGGVFDSTLDFVKNRNLQSSGSCNTVSGSDGYCVECTECDSVICLYLICCGEQCECAVGVNGDVCRSCDVCSNDNVAFDCSDEACGDSVGQTCSGSTISDPCPEEESSNGGQDGGSPFYGNGIGSGSNVLSLRGALAAMVVPITGAVLWY